jgi:trimeric autotransporter adhesin
MAINKDFIIPDAGLQVNGASVLSSTLGVNGAVTVANTIAVGNTTITGNVNVSVAANVGGAIRAGGLITAAAGADITGTANASVAINVGANVNLSVSAVNVGNSSSNTVVTQTSVNTGNSTLFTTIGQATGLFGNSSVNTAIGQATVNLGNTTVNTQITSSSFRTGNSSAYTNVTATALTTNGTLSVTGAATFSNTVTISGNLTVQGTTTFINTATLNVSDNIIALNSDVAGAPSENAGLEVNRGTSSNVSLIWNESTDRWQISSNTSTFGNIHSTLVDVALGTDTSGAYVATITGGDGLTGSGTGEGSTPTLAVGAANGITVSADAVAVTSANGITVTAAGVNVLANNGIIANTSGVFADGANGISVDASGINVLGNNGITVNASGVFADGANGISVDASGINVLAGTELTSNSSGVHHNDITRTNTTTGNTSPNYGGTFTAVDSVTTNARGHVTGVNTKTVTMPSSNNTTYDLLAVANTTASNAILRLTDSGSSNDSVFFVGLDEVVTSSNATHVVIDHADVARSNTTSTATPASGGTFTAVDSVVTNARGHVTELNLKTVTLPVDPNTTYTQSTVANTAANQGIARLTSSAGANVDNLVVGLDEITISSNSTAIYVDHNDVSRSDGTSSASPASGGTFTAVDSVTTNARGHVTGINLKTVTLPIDPNTTYTGANGVILAGTVFSANVGATLVANATGIHMPAVATAGSSSGGISAITIDAQGRVTSVTGSAGYVTSSGVTSVGATAPVESSGGTTPTISMLSATASRNGYMTSTYAAKLDGIAAGATNVTNTNQLTNGAGYITGITSGNVTTALGYTPYNATNPNGYISAVPNASTQVSSLGVGTAASGTGGEIRATNEITAYYSSDRDLKTNITPIEDALGKIRTLSGVMFDWTDEYIQARGGEDGYFVRKHDTGVIAQDVQAVLPEVVATREDGTLAVKYEKMMGLVIQSINELADLVDEIKTKVS